MKSTEPPPPDTQAPVGSVWAVYKSRFIPTQTFVLICSLLMYFVFKVNGVTVIAAWVFMQFASMWGAYTGKKLADRMGGR